MAWASTAPAAFTNLAANLRAWPGLAGVKVKDTGDLTDPDASQLITVGMLNPEEDTHAEASNARGSMAAGDQRETYTIHCGLAVATGDEEDPVPCRDAAFGLLAQVGACLAADQKLRGTVMKASISGWSLRIDQTDSGMRSQINFEVACDAFTVR